MYHISDIKKFLRCERLYHYSKIVNNVFNPYLRNDENTSELLKRYFRIDDCFTGIRNDENNHFFNEQDDHEWFFYPRFVLGELRINIPLMHKTDEGYDLYFLYYGTAVRELDTISYSTSIDVLFRLGIIVNRIFLIYFNGDYVNRGELDVDELFIVTDTYNGKNILDIVAGKPFDYMEYLAKMSSGNVDDAPPVKRPACRQMGLCEHYLECFPDERDLPEDSVLTLVSSGKKEALRAKGIERLKDIDPAMIEGTPVQYAQIMASRNGGIYIDRLGLRNWLNRISDRPISFIDFEWDRYLIPSYKGMKPMDVMCFEFALYYIDEAGHLEHRTFVSTGDCRREFVEALIGYLPKSGPILAYNAKGAECLRLKELGQMFPEYKGELDRLIERFYDLAVPFSEGLVYDIRMQGNFTLKKLVSICSEYSYDTLDIDDGMAAVFSWRDIDKNRAEAPERIIDNLKEYCSLDAYGLFLVYKWLIKLLIESE